MIVDWRQFGGFEANAKDADINVRQRLALVGFPSCIAKTGLFTRLSVEACSTRWVCLEKLGGDRVGLRHKFRGPQPKLGEASRKKKCQATSLIILRVLQSVD